MRNLFLIFVFLMMISAFSAGVLPVEAVSVTRRSRGIKSYFGYRFNLTYQLINMSRMLADIMILMIVGSVPDYEQGTLKLIWVSTRKTQVNQLSTQLQRAVQLRES